jgi:catechol 2,3-dioxygenase-like lactoylglutathione lyase family enzyme
MVPTGAFSRLMVLWSPFEPRDSLNAQQPGIGTSVTLGPPARVTTGCDSPNGLRCSRKAITAHWALDSRAAADGGLSEHQGLHHFAVRHETRSELADSVRRAQAAGVPITRAADFYVLEAVFINDPDDNGIELSWDRPRESWPEDWATSAGLGTPRPLNVEELLATAGVGD